MVIDKSFFDFQICKGSMNSIPVHCGIVTENESKGKKIIKEIIDLFDEDEIFRITKSNLNNRCEIRLKNGTRIVWVKSLAGIRGYRFMKGIIDKDTPKEVLWQDVLPTLCYAKDEDIIYF